MHILATRYEMTDAVSIEKLGPRLHTGLGDVSCVTWLWVTLSLGLTGIIHLAGPSNRIRVVGIRLQRLLLSYH